VKETGSFFNRLCWCGSQGGNNVLDHADAFLVDSRSFHEENEQSLDISKPASSLRPTIPIEKDNWQREEAFQEQKENTERDDSSCQRITPPINHCTSFGTGTTVTMRSISYFDESSDEENDDADSTTTTEIVSHGNPFRPVYSARTNGKVKGKEPYRYLLRMTPSNYLGGDHGQYSARCPGYPAEKDTMLECRKEKSGSLTQLPWLDLHDDGWTGQP
jgi:hypothetical protein